MAQTRRQVAAEVWKTTAQYKPLFGGIQLAEPEESRSRFVASLGLGPPARCPFSPLFLGEGSLLK